jgi:hypothetical protein
MLRNITDKNPQGLRKYCEPFFYDKFQESIDELHEDDYRAEIVMPKKWN